MTATDWADSERRVREELARAQEPDERSKLTETLAWYVENQGRLDEAEALCREAERLAVKRTSCFVSTARLLEMRYGDAADPEIETRAQTILSKTTGQEPNRYNAFVLLARLRWKRADAAATQALLTSASEACSDFVGVLPRRVLYGLLRDLARNKEGAAIATSHVLALRRTLGAPLPREVTIVLDEIEMTASSTTQR